MKKLIIALLAVLAVAVSFSGCAEKLESGSGMLEDAVMAENVTAFDVYYKFLFGLKSARITRTVSDTGDLFGALSYTSEEIIYSSPCFLYRKNTPIVFFYKSPYNYFDGENYYYKYNRRWFVEASFKKATTDFFGIDARIFDEYTTTFNALFRKGSEYILKAQGEKRDGSRYEFTAKADEKFTISEILLEERIPSGSSVRTVTTKMTFSDVNGDIEVSAPEDLNI